jgi:hypothetical protein
MKIAVLNKMKCLAHLHFGEGVEQSFPPVLNTGHTCRVNCSIRKGCYSDEEKWCLHYYLHTGQG